MLKTVCLFLLFLFPTLLSAQSALYSDPPAAQIVQKDCNDHVFTKVQVLPSLKISKDVFEDTLIKELKDRKFAFKDNEITYRFVVTSHSQILDLTIDSGNISKEKVLRETLLKLSDVWLPAKQNGYPVCSYVRLKLSFTDSSIRTEIFQ